MINPVCTNQSMHQWELMKANTSLQPSQLTSRVVVRQENVGMYLSRTVLSDMYFHLAEEIRLVVALLYEYVHMIEESLSSRIASMHDSKFNAKKCYL